MRMKTNHPVKEQEQEQEDEYYAMADGPSNESHRRKKMPTASVSKKSVHRRDERGGNSPQKVGENSNKEMADTQKSRSRIN